MVSGRLYGERTKTGTEGNHSAIRVFFDTLIKLLRRSMRNAIEINNKAA